jgi:hypothetical protein
MQSMSFSAIIGKNPVLDRPDSDEDGERARDEGPVCTAFDVEAGRSQVTYVYYNVTVTPFQNVAFNGSYAERVTKTHLVLISLSCSLLLPQPAKQRHRLNNSW